MHIIRKRLFILLALTIAGFSLSLTPTLISVAHQTDASLPAPITPEPYPNTDIYPAVIYLASEDDLRVLYRLNIDIDGLHPVEGNRFATGSTFIPSIATVYINPDQSDALSRLGLSPVPIANEGYRGFLAYGPGSGQPGDWPTFEEYVTRMQDLKSAHSDIVDLVSIGTSVLGRNLWCMEITDNPGVDELEPEFKYTANHHGDEITGIEMTMRLAELLANGYGSDPEITNIVNSMETWLCPIYNPDGYVSGNRYNAHGVDLNRDFPDRITDPIDDPSGREPETQAFMIFGYDHRFSMGANYHGGAQVLNYPWDSIAAPEYAPDDQLFFDFGLGYTSRNSYLWNGGWPYGMTRGWEWYIIRGGMQDWAYYWHGEHHVTLEISDNKHPPFTAMDDYWNENQEAMLWWMQRALTGLSGVVLDAYDNTPLDATVTLDGWSQPPLNTIHTDPDAGDYHRVISEGDYTLTASASCYQNQTAEVSVISGTVTSQDFYLDALPDFNNSSKLASVDHANPLDVVNYQIRVENTCPSAGVSVTDTLPAEVTWTGYLSATQGIPVFDAGRILWQGEVDSSQAVTITYAVSLNECLAADLSLLNLAEFDDSVNDIITRTAEISVSNVPPSSPESPIPDDGATGQLITTTLTWAPSTDLNCDSISYDLAFGTSPMPPIIVTGLSAFGYDPGPLLSGTTYYWFVVAQDGLTHTVSPVWRFSTAIDLYKTFLPMAVKGMP